MDTKLTELSLDVIKTAIKGTAAAFRCVTEYQPAGGQGDKVFPPTHEGGEYAFEKRKLPDREVPIDCVLLDSVQSQANRMELALLEQWDSSKDNQENERFPLPVLTVDFTGKDLEKVLRITSLEAPHRIADALLRDSYLEQKRFRDSEKGKRINDVDNHNATHLFELCPTALIFGVWDSTGPKGGLGAKFARAMVSEIIGIDAQVGKKTSSRIDPAMIFKGAGPLFKSKNGGWTLDINEAEIDQKKKEPIKLGKDGNPAEANHGNIPPSIKDGGVTIHKAIHTTVLSLPALRRLHFPIGEKRNIEKDYAARTVLAALALCAAVLTREQGCDLRSRCQLHATSPIVWELLDKPGEKPHFYSLSSEKSIDIYKTAVKEAKNMDLPYQEKEIILTPSPELLTLVKKSQELAAKLAIEPEEVK